VKPRRTEAKTRWWPEPERDAVVLTGWRPLGIEIENERMRGSPSKKIK